MKATVAELMRRLPGPATAQWPQGERFAYTRSWLAKNDRPTAVVGYGPEDAMSTATAALSLGLKIPEDLSIVAIHDRPLDESGLVFTTAWVEAREMGRRAVGMLLEKLEQPLLQQPTVSIPYRLQPGATTAAPRR